jgi:hypothetical protein
MSYKDLPPGRTRMMTYANEIQRHKLRPMNMSETVVSVLNEISTTRNSITSQDIIFGTSQTNRMYNIERSPFYEYEVLSELPAVKIGLISKGLLDKSKIESSKDVSFCTICQEDIVLDIIRTLDCLHCFHVNCIDTWFTENKKCPQCRFEL